MPTLQGAAYLSVLYTHTVRSTHDVAQRGTTRHWGKSAHKGESAWYSMHMPLALSLLVARVTTTAIVQSPTDGWTLEG